MKAGEEQVDEGLEAGVVVAPSERVGTLQADEAVKRGAQGSACSSGVAVSEAVVSEDGVHGFDRADAGGSTLGPVDGAEGELVTAGMIERPLAIGAGKRTNRVVAGNADGGGAQDVAEVGSGRKGEVIEETGVTGDMAVQARRLDFEQVGDGLQADSVDAGPVEHGEAGADDIAVFESALLGHGRSVGVELP